MWTLSPYDSILFLFLFKDTAPTEIYPPSPTRRSSDLERAELIREETQCPEVAGRRHDIARRALDRLDDDRRHVLGGLELRSEEHTSELQSQSNLVCRLLLEKKKHTELPPRTHEIACAD